MKADMCVAVGMSGGLDSSMVVRRLLAHGYRVIGLTMSLWDGSVPISPEHATRGGCFGPKESLALDAARAVARQLGIEHHIIPLASAFRDHVLNPFVAGNLAGETPNPCALCNPLMKFGALWKAVEAQGIAFDYFATGHYARIQRDEAGGFHLLRGVDGSKDQSYFLSRLSQAQLARTLFPLGDDLKSAVRVEASDAGFEALATKKESQDFFQGDDVSVLYPPERICPGPIVDDTGKRLGTHRGLMFYTRGQSAGLGVATGRKMYVHALRVADNTLVLGDRADVMNTVCHVRDMRWIAGVPPADGMRCMARLRYRHAGGAARVAWQGDELILTFDEPQFAVTPGQLAVVYDGDECLGGGWIAGAEA